MDRAELARATAALVAEREARDQLISVGR
jgi:hypothetical protein